MEQGIRFPSPTLKTQTLWNAGKMVGAKRALKEKHVWAIRFWLAHEGRIRDRALFDLALDSKPLLRDPDIQVADVARRYGVSRTTLYKHVGEQRQRCLRTPKIELHPKSPREGLIVDMRIVYIPIIKQFWWARSSHPFNEGLPCAGVSKSGWSSLNSASFGRAGSTVPTS